MQIVRDVEGMNRFELMNEVERLRKTDKIAELKAEVGQLRHELRLMTAKAAKLKKSLDFIVYSGRPELRAQMERRKQPQGRRRATRR